MNENKDSPDPEQTEHLLAEGVVCTACVEVNPPRIDYCTKCGAPLNSLVAFNPFGQTLVEGFAYRRAVDGPPSKIIVAGMWVLFSPALFLGLFVVIPDWQYVSRISDLPRLLFEHGYLESYFVVAVIILFRTTTNYFAKRRAPKLDNVEKIHSPGNDDAAPFVGE